MHYLLIIGLLLCGCTRSFLTVQTEYLRRENLASFHVNTPDPLLNRPLIGQRLMVRWSLPPSYQGVEDLHLEVSIRFSNHTQSSLHIPIYDLSGMYVYTIHNEEYTQKGGFLTYRAELYSKECLIDSWQHQLWTELIELGN